MFKSPKQRLAFFHALKNKQDGQMPLAMPLANPNSPPGMAMNSQIGGAIKQMPINPAAMKPANPMNFLKLRKTLKPKF